jgi:hypothetical protein
MLLFDRLDIYVICEICMYMNMYDYDMLYYVSKFFRRYINKYIANKNMIDIFSLYNTQYFFNNITDFPYLTLTYINRILQIGNKNIIKFIYDVKSQHTDYQYIFDNPNLYFKIIQNNNLDILQLIDNCSTFIQNNSTELYIFAIQLNNIDALNLLFNKKYTYNSHIYYNAIHNAIHYNQYDTIKWLIINKFSWNIQIVKYIKIKQNNEFLKWFIDTNIKYNNYNHELINL